MRVTYKNLFSAEDTQTLSIDEINEAIDARLSGVEGALPVPEKKPFQTMSSKRLAEGLHYILYYCPKCEAEYCIETQGCTIRCSACGNEAVMDRTAKLTPVSGSIVAGEGTVVNWFEAQVRNEMKSLSDDMQPFIEKVKVRTPSPEPGNGMIESGSGIMRLDPEGWHFEGEISGEKVSLFFSIESIPAMSYDHYDNYQIYHGGNYYMFIPEDVRKCLKYVIIAELMHWRFSPKVLMTPGIVKYN